MEHFKKDKLVVGIDLDNTIISYDAVLQEWASENGYTGRTEDHKFLSKNEIRSRIRAKQGDIEWQKVQALLYTELMQKARLFPGVEHFFEILNYRKAQVYLVSHKTEFAKLDPKRINLRQKALSWLQEQGFFDPSGFNLNRDQLFFESTRINKIKRIKMLGCKHFIDDLIELFQEETFPTNIKKVLFDPYKQQLEQVGEIDNFVVLNSWKEIADYFFVKSRAK